MATFYLLSSTNVALPLAQWRRASTNVFDAAGGFQFILPVNYAVPQEFFGLIDSRITNALQMSVTRSGNNLVVTGTGGTPMASFYVLSTTNLALPMGQWRRTFTNSFDAAGGFQFTLAINYAVAQEFFRLSR